MKKRNRQTPRPTIDPGTIIAIMLMVLLGLGMYMTLNPGRAGAFTSYAGPILPLSSLSGEENITAERHVALDFGAYADPELDEYNGQITVTDTYVLTNTTQQDVTVELVWGFEGQFTDPGVQFPAITADGVPADGTIYPATDNGELVRNAASFEKYKQVLTENDFLAEAMAPMPRWDAPVKVYHFYDLAYSGESITGGPYLDIGYKLGENSTVWVRSFDAGGYVEGKYRLKYDVDRGEVWLYVVGDDLTELEAVGTRGINVTIDAVRSEALEGVTYNLETWESTFMACLEAYSGEFVFVPHSDWGQRLELVTPEVLFDGAMKRIVGSDYRNPSSNVRSMDTVLDSVYVDIRMLYWVFPVEIPAGGCVTVSGRYDQESSRDFTATRHGYDLATTLGSNLNFTAMTAEIRNGEWIIIADDGQGQNFGFDPAGGITTVTLEPGQERYYLDLILPEAGE